MTPKAYEKSLFALRVYQASKSDNIDELLAIACVFRNRVFKFGKTYSQILENAEVNRGWPAMNNPVMTNPTNGLLAQIDGIYSGDTPDLTSNHLHQNGALYFGRVVDHQGTGSEFETVVLLNQVEHPLIGTFGVQQFYE